MDIKPGFAIAVVACCMTASFVLKVYTNQANVIFFGPAKNQEVVRSKPEAFKDYYQHVKASSTTPAPGHQLRDEFSTRIITVKLYSEAPY